MDMQLCASPSAHMSELWDTSGDDAAGVDGGGGHCWCLQRTSPRTFPEQGLSIHSLLFRHKCNCRLQFLSKKPSKCIWTYSTSKALACLPGELWVATSCPVSKQGVQEVCSVLLGTKCAAIRHNTPWFGQPFPCIWPGQPGICSCRGQSYQMGYKTWANPDTGVPLLAKHLVGPSESPPHPGDNYLTRHCSLSPSPPSSQNKLLQTKVSPWKVMVFPLRSVLNCFLHPTACCQCCHCSLCLCCWNVETKGWVFSF